MKEADNLLKASRRILKWYDDENNIPHSTEEWIEAYDGLRNAVENCISIKPPVLGWKILLQKILYPIYFPFILLWLWLTDDK